MRLAPSAAPGPHTSAPLPTAPVGHTASMSALPPSPEGCTPAHVCTYVAWVAPDCGIMLVNKLNSTFSSTGQWQRAFAQEYLQLGVPSTPRRAVPHAFSLPAAKLPLGSGCRASTQCAGNAVCAWMTNANMGICAETAVCSTSPPEKDDACKALDPLRPYCNEEGVCASAALHSGAFPREGFALRVCSTLMQQLAAVAARPARAPSRITA